MVNSLYFGASSLQPSYQPQFQYLEILLDVTVWLLHNTSQVWLSLM